MFEEKIEISQLIEKRNIMLQKEKELYLTTIEKINMGTRELLNNDFGTTLVRNTAQDLAGELVRRFFDFGDCYITADQLVSRIINFSYDNDVDLLSTDEKIRKDFYNYKDAIYSKGMKNITEQCMTAQKQLFTLDRSKDKLDRKGKWEYRQKKTTEDGKIYDELTGQEGGTKIIIKKNGRKEKRSELQADHIQAREAITYNERYIRKEKDDKLKQFYNSADNMQMIHASANASKGDVRICEKEGKIIHINSKELKRLKSENENIIDITYKATPEQLAEAYIAQWEKESKSENKIQILKKNGYLDENGKVRSSVKRELLKKIKHSQNKESIEILKATNYEQVAKDAAASTKYAMKKIIGGQLIYYILPPVIFETKTILKKKDLTLDKFLKEIKKAGKRIIQYVSSKMGEIFNNIAENTINKFIKTFFDIIIEVVKATVKRLMKIVKSLVLSIVNCIKIIADKDTTPAQKADSVIKILSVTITNIVMELLFEYLEKQFGLPDILMEPLQIIVTVLCTNIIMLVLQKADLFNVQYGLLISNIEKVFEQENEKYLSESIDLYENSMNSMEELINDIQLQINDLRKSIDRIDVYKDEAMPYLQKISEKFQMEIDFNKEWENFLEVK